MICQIDYIMRTCQIQTISPQPPQNDERIMWEVQSIKCIHYIGSSMAGHIR